MLPKVSENIANIVLVFLGFFGEDEDVIKINHNVLVKDVGEDAVHEALEGRRHIHEAEVHDQEIERAVSHSEGSFPFVTGSNADEVVGAT